MSTTISTPDKLPPLIKEVNVKEDDKKNQRILLEVQLNPTLQRLVYEQLYKEHAKEAEMKGFRKGNVPREILEPQIYQQLVEKTLSTLIVGLPSELAKKLPEVVGEDRIVVGDPYIEDLQFKMVEAPIVLTVRLYWAPSPKLPDLKKYYFSDEIKVDVSEKEVEEALSSLFADWQKRVDKRKQAEFSKPSNEWVKELKLPNITNLKELKEHLRKIVESNKRANTLVQKYEEVFHQIIHDLDVKIPASLIEERYKQAKEEIEKNMQRLGVTFQDYLKANNLTEEQFREQITHQVVDEIKHRVFWNLYIKTRNISIDPQKDRMYLERAAFDYASAGKAKISSIELLTRALLVKAEESLLRELGFIKQDKKEETKEAKKPESSKILIPDDAKI